MNRSQQSIVFQATVSTLLENLRLTSANIPHVAVSIFIFDGNRLLLQQRAKTKYHSAGLWANTVCSHPRWNEAINDCAQRRLHEELGWQVPLNFFGVIDYTAKVGDLFENEHVHCLYGKHNNRHNIGDFNPLEVEATEWLTIPEIQQQIESHPHTFTEWFKIYMSKYQSMIDTMLR